MSTEASRTGSGQLRQHRTKGRTAPQNVTKHPHRGRDPAADEGIWSLLKRAMVNFAAADLDGLVRIVKRKLKKIQYRPHLIDGCLAATGLTIEPW